MAELGGESTPTPCRRWCDRDPDPDAWVRALGVRAARPPPAAKAEAWHRAVVDRTVPIQSAGKVAAAFWRPGQDELLAPYAERYLELLSTCTAGGMIPGMAFTANLFPLFAIDESFVARAREVPLEGRAGRRQRARRAIRRGAADGAQPRLVRLCPPR